jgi:hypothetical protein
VFGANPLTGQRVGAAYPAFIMIVKQFSRLMPFSAVILLHAFTVFMQTYCAADTPFFWRSLSALNTNALSFSAFFALALVFDRSFAFCFSPLVCPFITLTAVSFAHIGHTFQTHDVFWRGFIAFTNRAAPD